jgi:hypothetical protein
MSDAWLKLLGVKATLWDIPADNITALTAANAKAKAILAVVQSGERTASSVVQCKEAFKELVTEARFIKTRDVLSPPLDKGDYPNLLLPLPDETPTPVPPPSGQPLLAINYPGGPHVLSVHFSEGAGMESGNARRGDYGYALYRGIMPQGGATLEQAASVKHYLMSPPLSGAEMLHYRFTRRKKELIDFAATEAGMTVYFCARYENQKGEYGAWGPVVQTIIP